MSLESEIVEQARALCRDYIYDRLKRDGVTSHKLHADENPPCSETSLELQRFGAELERMYPKLYKDISRQLNTTLGNEETMKTLYTDIAEQIIKGGISWGKVVSLLALAGSFAEDCVRQGHVEHVNPLVENFVFFVERNLVIWLAEKGGWTSIIKSFQPKKDKSLFWFVSGIGALIGFLVTILATLGL